MWFLHRFKPEEWDQPDYRAAACQCFEIPEYKEYLKLYIQEAFRKVVVKSEITTSFRPGDLLPNTVNFNLQF